MKNSLRRAFTLIEVLVVVAILLALAALVFVMANRGSESAKSVATLNNLREIGVAAASWTGDNNSFFMPCWDNTSGRNRSYAQVLDPYLHGVDEYRKPDSKFVGPNARLPMKVNAYSHPITFSLNRAVCRDVTDYGGFSESLIHVTQVERPSEVIMMADGCQNPRNLNQANASAYRIYDQTGDSGPLSEWDEAIAVGPDVDESRGDGWFRYHNGKCHALFCDGSSRAMLKGTIKKRNLWLDIVREATDE